MNDLIITPNGSGWIAIILLIRTITWSCPPLALLDVRFGGEQIHFGAGECRAEPRIAGHPAQSRFFTCRLRPIDWPRSAIGRDIAKSVFQVHGSYHPRAASDRMRPLQLNERCL